MSPTPTAYRTTGLPDYNRHYGIRELCDICPAQQLKKCATGHQVPTEEALRETAAQVPGQEHFGLMEISERAATLTGLDEQPRYFLQHALNFQIHDQRHPHHQDRHGRADIGWAPEENTDA